MALSFMTVSATTLAPVALSALFLAALAASAGAAPNLRNHMSRPLQFRPENGSIVGENGAEYFNRPLYGGNTAFRVDAGDKPELSLYLPGRGGNLDVAAAEGRPAVAVAEGAEAL